MSNKTEQALEHGEHAGHAAHDPFDKRVTVTIVVTAALLACATMLSHRAHTLTLQLQMQANEDFTNASNQWNYFQSKKNRQYLYETAATMTRLDQEKPGLPEGSSKWKSASQKEIDGWLGKAGDYRKDTARIEKEAEGFMEAAKEKREESEHIHHIGDRYDMAELGIELGLVLCSMAILTKKHGFWYSGMAASGVGFVLMLWGILGQYFLH